MDIIESIEKIEKFTKNMTYEVFQNDDKTIFAVIRGLEIIGEASKKIPSTIRKNYPAIPWKLMSGMRDKLIHDYFGVNIKVIWQTAIEDVPPLKQSIKNILIDLEKQK